MKAIQLMLLMGVTSLTYAGNPVVSCTHPYHGNVIDNNNVVYEANLSAELDNILIYNPLFPEAVSCTVDLVKTKVRRNKTKIKFIILHPEFDDQLYTVVIDN